ncbi:MAG: calcium/sodium antiporter [Pseudomonadota bacterium]
MIPALLAIAGGLVALIWSAGWFVDGAAATARHFGMSSLLIGMLIVGFGTSAPEIVVSVQSALDGSTPLAIGNALGSNVANIGLILGLVALISPITVQSKVLRRELPVLFALTGLLGWFFLDGRLNRLDAVILLGAFAALVAWSIYTSIQLSQEDSFGQEVYTTLSTKLLPLNTALFKLSVGLMALIISARVLVWGAVLVAGRLGVSELVIGLTIVAIGTSLPELAASLVAVSKGEHEIALGNVLGSNLFNTLVVIGLAGAIAPVDLGWAVLHRDWRWLFGMTGILFIFGYRRGGHGRINRFEGAALLLAFLVYMGWLVRVSL